MSLPTPPNKPHRLRPLPAAIFATRWLQLPLYLGLILAQAVYVFHFWVELVHLIEAVFGSEKALAALVQSIGYQLAPIKDAAGAVVGYEAPKLNETVIMLVVLALIDVVMISNLLIMVIVGGYETFVSRMGLEEHPDQPEWLSHVNASVLKVKLATAIIGISSIHLLKTFISAGNYTEKVLMWQTLIHITFLLSAIAIAATDRLMSSSTSSDPH
ncbi:MAG: TIGR00645 family protein [Burkholderiales bacterium PBB1]|nr:MAG: TIGR00645 family protein [Burkholderiales bacterium PBB1]